MRIYGNRRILFLLILLFSALSYAQDEGQIVKNSIFYYPSETLLAQNSDCVLDLHYSKDKKGFATLVWFHGGGLTAGKRTHLPKTLFGNNFAVVTVEYRLSPKVKAPECIDDAAAAIAWVLQNIGQFGGDPNKIFIGGHSAGAYLAGMVALNPRYLKKYSILNLDLKGVILVSGQATTHFRVKSDLGDTENAYLPIINEYAIMKYATQRIPNLQLIVGDPELEWKVRNEENRMLYATLQAIGAINSNLIEIKGESHSSVVNAAVPYIIKYINNSLIEDHNSIALPVESWKHGQSIIDIEKGDGYGIFEAKTDDPVMSYKFDNEISTEKYNILQFDMKVDPDCGLKFGNFGEEGAIFWTTDSTIKYTGEARIPIKLIADGKWFTYQVKLSKSDKYSGDLRSIRIDPIEQCKIGKQFSIKNIQLLNTN